MSWSVSDTFERIRSYTPRSLDQRALDRCAGIAERVPDEASSHYLEFRLNSGPQIDFLTFTRQKTIAAGLDARLGPHRSQSWRENIAILREWASGETELTEAPGIYLEYDCGDSFVETEPEASVVVALEPGYHSRHWEVLRESDAKVAALGRAVFRRLLPEVMRESCLAVLERCYAALPPKGAIPHAPVMAAREPVTAKPYVILPRESVYEFLEQIGWPGSMAKLQRLLESYYAPFQQTVYLDVTVTDRVCERLGLATSQFQRQEVDFSSLDWWRLPSSLARYKDELRDWVGHSEEWMGGHRVWIHRWLDTKAVLDGSEIEYKGYLGFSPTHPPLFC